MFGKGSLEDRVRDLEGTFEVFRKVNRALADEVKRLEACNADTHRMALKVRYGPPGEHDREVAAIRIAGLRSRVSTLEASLSRAEAERDEARRAAASASERAQRYMEERNYWAASWLEGKGIK